jgi:hypothetical protein
MQRIWIGSWIADASLYLAVSVANCWCLDNTKMFCRNRDRCTRSKSEKHRDSGLRNGLLMLSRPVGKARLFLVW